MSIKRLVGSASLCAVLMWLSIGSTINLQRSETSPNLVAAWWPFGAQVSLNRATNLLVSGATAEQVDEGRAQAVKALIRQPVSAAAVRLIGLSMAMLAKNRTADAFFAQAERRSRRDLPTQMWFIQRAVDSGNVSAALNHYNIALTTHADAAELLLPTLAAASANVPISTALLPILQRRPVWFNGYFEVLVTGATDAPTLFMQAQGVHLSHDRDKELLAAAVSKLSSLKRPDLGLELLGPSYASNLRNGSFESDASFLPFDWWLRDDSNLAAYRSAETGGHGPMVLRISAKNEVGGEVAHQMLMLKPGRYVLRGIISGVTDEQDDGESNTLNVEVVCESSNRIAASISLLAKNKPNPFSVTFSSAQDCPSQWLRFLTKGASTFDGWIDGITISKSDALAQ